MRENFLNTRDFFCANNKTVIGKTSVHKINVFKHGIMYKMSNIVEAEGSYEYKKQQDTALSATKIYST